VLNWPRLVSVRVVLEIALETLPRFENSRNVEIRVVPFASFTKWNEITKTCGMPPHYNNGLNCKILLPCALLIKGSLFLV
jgi:hypothetical protein